MSKPEIEKSCAYVPSDTTYFEFSKDLTDGLGLKLKDGKPLFAYVARESRYFSLRSFSGHDIPTHWIVPGIKLKEKPAKYDSNLRIIEVKTIDFRPELEGIITDHLRGIQALPVIFWRESDIKNSPKNL